MNKYKCTYCGLEHNTTGQADECAELDVHILGPKEDLDAYYGEVVILPHGVEFVPVNITVPDQNPEHNMPNVKCDCGADSCGLSEHYDWCQTIDRK